MIAMLALAMRLYTFVPADPVLADLGVYPMTSEDFEDETANSAEDDSDDADDESDADDSCGEW